MAYIGAVAPGYDPTRASVPQLDAERFNGDASTTAFTLARQVVSPTDIDVVVENVTQEPTVAYSVNGNTLTFTEAPGSGTNNIYVIYRGSGISNYAFVPDGSITFAKLANNIKQFTVDAVTANGTGTTVELTEAPASANSIIVSVDGVIQTAPTNYTLSGSTITFTGTPDNGANVVVRHIGFRTTSTVTALQASSVTATELADSSVTNAKIVSVANTKISGNIVSSQITSVANTQITGNIISSQISPSVTLYGNPTVTSGNLTVGGSTSLGTASVSGNTSIYQAPGSSFLIMNVNGTLAGARRNWAISPEYDSAGGLSFSVGASEGAAPSTPRLIIKQQGALVLSNGSTSVDGTGITFPATQNASSDANTLDDYEEGSWTPTLGGNSTYSYNEGKYVKIGNFVYVTGIVIVTSLGTGSTTTLSGLPFTSFTQANRHGGSIAYYSGSAVSIITMYIFNNNNSTTLQFSTVTASQTGVDDTRAIFANGTHVQFSLSYRAG
jgi:hypothetical protein